MISQGITIFGKDGREVSDDRRKRELLLKTFPRSLIKERGAHMLRGKAAGK